MAYLLGGIGAGILIMFGFNYWAVLRHKRKNKIPSLTKYVAFSLTMVIVYTITAIVYQWVKDQELSGTLTTCFFNTFGGEVIFCAILKIFKICKGGNGNEP